MRAIIIEQWAILRGGLRAVVGDAGHPVACAAASAQEGLEAVRHAHDLGLVVIGAVGDADRAALVAEVVAAVPKACVVVLADHPDRAEIDALLQAGAAGILGRLTESGQLVAGLAQVGGGNRVLSEEVIGTLVRAIEPTQRAPLALRSVTGTDLTAREAEVLGWLATGATNRAIAAQLFIGEATVKTHLSSAYAKLGVSDRHRAVARAIEMGLVGLSAAS